MMTKTTDQIKEEIKQAEAEMNELAAPSDYPSYEIRQQNGQRGKDGKPIYDRNGLTWDDHRQTILQLRRELENAQSQPMTEAESKRVDYFNQAFDDYYNE